MTFYVDEKQDESRQGGQAKIYRVFSFSGSYDAQGQPIDKTDYAAKVQLTVSENAVSARRELAGEALVYFDIDPSKSPHLALLNDVVPHPQRPDVPVLITPWASESLHEWLYARDGCGQHGCDQRRQAGSSGELLRCGRCRVALYCCKEHQAADWKARHQRECGFARRAGMRETLEIAMQTARGLKSLHVSTSWFIKI